MKKLTKKFNTATLKKGEIFQISLPIGGLISQCWDEVKVVSGKATLLSEPNDRSGGCMGPFSAEWTYKAEDAGDIELVATSRQMRETCTFKVRVT